MAVINNSIFTRLFLAVLSATLVVILFMVIFMNWSFRQGFADFQHGSELVTVQELSELLSGQYRQENSWDFLRKSTRRWQSILFQVGDQRLVRSLGERLRLLDRNGEVIRDKKTDAAEQDRIPVLLDNVEIGWLELDRQPDRNNEIANKFMEQQARNIVLIALFAALLSLLVAWIVVRQLLRPVKRLTEGAKLMAQGHFSTHIPVSSQDELGELATRFNQLSEFLQRNEELRGQWIADISHELRTPIAVLRSEIEAMLDGIREPTLERIRSLHADILSLGKLVDDLYQLSLSDAGDIERPDEVVELNSLLADVLSSFESRFQEKSIRLMNQLDPASDLLVLGDDKRLYQLFSNLLENSYRYTDEGGQVEVHAHRRADKVVIQVIDSKPGVPDAALPRLFDRLYRVDRSRSRVLGGSGLGLSICKNIVELHRGSMTADHSRLGGLMIQVELAVLSSGTVR